MLYLLPIFRRTGREHVEKSPQKPSNAPFLTGLALFFLPKSLSRGEIFKNFLGRCRALEQERTSSLGSLACSLYCERDFPRCALVPNGSPVAPDKLAALDTPWGPPSPLTCVKLRRPTRQASRTLRAHRAWPLPMARPSEGLPLSPTTHIIYTHPPQTREQFFGVRCPQMLAFTKPLMEDVCVVQ